MEYMITCIGIVKPEDKVKFEKFARVAISDYMRLKNKVKFLEFKVSLYEHEHFKSEKTWIVLYV